MMQSPLAAGLAVYVALVTWVTTGGAPLVEAQVERGQPSAAHAALLMRQLDGVKRVLMIAAHPDDEDSSLLAALSRAWGAETAYLSLTRGDGGQNLIGPELGEGLGAIRTGELVAARNLDGGEQFFSRAFDFGYSKSAAEALAFWAEDDVLADAVWIIRTFRPHVVVSQWSGTPRDGHGQHQASGIVAREAYAAAGDPSRFPEQLVDGVEVWQPQKLYLGFRRASEGEALAVPTGTFDPLLGRSHFQLGMASRSMHQSQDMGVQQPAGPRVSSIQLIEGPLTVEEDDSPFAGIDTTLIGLAAGVGDGPRPAIVDDLDAYRQAVHTAQQSLDVSAPWSAAQWLGQALRSLEDAAGATAALDDPPSELARVLDHRRGMVETAMLAAAGVTVGLRVEDDMLVPGQEVLVHAEVWNGGELNIEDAMPSLELPEGWRLRWATEEERNPRQTGFFNFTASATQKEGPANVAPGELARWSYHVTLPASASVTRQYYLAEPREGAMYHWPDDRALWGLPRNPPEITATVEASLVAGDAPSVRVAPTVPGRYVGVDRATGEFQRPVLVVPAVSVAMDPARMVWPTASQDSRRVTVQVSNEAASGSQGTVSLELPAGWRADPAEHSFDLTAPGVNRAFTFDVVPTGPVAEGEHTFGAVAQTTDGQTFREGMSLIDYPHIERLAMFSPAQAKVAAFSARVTEGLRVGYIMGSGDSGPVAIRQLGVQVDELGPDAVASGSFDDFDVIVVGVRAYQTRPELAAANDQLLDFARRGGTVVVQYNQFEFSQGNYGPYPLQISRDRVAEEDAAVTVLDPTAPVLTSPNTIDANDFDGWMQERGLYFPNEWDNRYRPLFSMADVGEDAKEGSLLVAPVGEGVYVYAALSFFRQFPTGVPGAYRLFANLISLDGDTWNQYVAESQQP